MFIVFDLSPEAIATLNKVANKQGVSRSELVERYIESAEPLLDAAEAVLLDATSNDYCFPPHPSYNVDGEVIRQLSSAYKTFNLQPSTFNPCQPVELRSLPTPNPLLSSEGGF